MILNKDEQEFWDNCLSIGRNDKKKFLKAVRKTFKQPSEIWKNLSVVNNSLLYNYSLTTGNFYLNEAYQHIKAVENDI